MNSRLLRVKSDEVQQEESIKSLEEAFNTVTQEITSRKEAQTVMEAKLNEFRETIAKMDQALRDAQVQYHQDKTRLEAVSNLTERYEGYGGSIRRVMEQKDKNPGIIGVVADIIKVEKKYETAIETALGGSIQNIVTDNEETAKGMIFVFKADQKRTRDVFAVKQRQKRTGISAERSLKGAWGFRTCAYSGTYG